MDIEIDLECPGCKKKFKEKIANMKPGGSTKCPHCKQEITFKGDDLTKVQKSIDDLERTIKDLNKTIKIKF